MFDPFVPIQPTPSLSSIGAPKQYSLFINSGTLQSLGMTSLQRVASGNILLYQSENLCYVAPKMWNKITKPRTDQTVELYQNMDEEMCSKYCMLPGCGVVCREYMVPCPCCASPGITDLLLLEELFLPPPIMPKPRKKDRKKKRNAALKFGSVLM